MIARRSEELGIVNEYSDELLAAKGDIAELYESMVSYNQVYQMMCACPEDFGMSGSFADKVFSNGTEAHADDGHGHQAHAEKALDDEDEKNKKKKRRLGWLGLR